MSAPDDNTSASSDLWRWSATLLRDAIRTGDVSTTARIRPAVGRIPEWSPRRR